MYVHIFHVLNANIPISIFNNPKYHNKQFHQTRLESHLRVVMNIWYVCCWQMFLQKFGCARHQITNFQIPTSGTWQNGLQEQKNGRGELFRLCIQPINLHGKILFCESEIIVIAVFSSNNL